MSIKVSLITPAYNVEDFIEKTLLSAINQTLKELEIIIINDGSTDNTLKIIEKTCTEYGKERNIVIVNQENSGSCAARNAGLVLAKGKYIQYLDGDDILEVTASEKMYLHAINQKLDIVFCDYYWQQDYFDTNISYMKTLNMDRSDFTSEEFLYIFFRGFKDLNPTPAIWNKLIRKEIHEGITFVEGIEMEEDAIINLKLIFKAHRIGGLKEALVHYIFNPNGMTKGRINKRYQRILGQQEIKSFFIKNQAYEKYKNEIDGLLLPRALSNFLKNEIYLTNKNYNEALEVVLDVLKKEKVSIMIKMGTFTRLSIKLLNHIPRKGLLLFIIRANLFLRKVLSIQR